MGAACRVASSRDSTFPSGIKWVDFLSDQSCWAPLASTTRGLITTKQTEVEWSTRSCTAVVALQAIVAEQWKRCDWSIAML